MIVVWVMPIFKMLMIILLFGYKSRKKQQFLHEIVGQGLNSIWEQAVFGIKKFLEIETPIDLFQGIHVYNWSKAYFGLALQYDIM